MAEKKAARGVQPVTIDPGAENKPAITTSSIVAAKPRPKLPPNPRDPNKKSPAERALRGDYRVIHGMLHVPRDPSTYLNDRGEPIAGRPMWDEAHEGDVVRLNDNDAAVAVDGGVVERLDTKPSRQGKVFQPPKIDWDMRPDIFTKDGRSTIPGSGVAVSRP